jgi:membrane fusion protein, multidrug efflux system
VKRWLAVLLVGLLLGALIYYNKFRNTDAGSASGGGKPEGAAAAKPGGGGKAGTDGKTGGGGSGKGGPVTVTAYVVATQNLTNSVVATGSLLPNESVDIYPEVNGRIVTLNILEGRPVAKGALLVKLYDGDLQAQLLKLRAVQENNQRIEERNKQLLQRGGISQQEYDIVVTNLKSASADIEVTKAQIRRTEIYAPFSGVIGLRNVSLGAVVSPQLLIARLQQVSTLKLDFSVPERYAARITPGKTVTFTIDGTGGNFAGRIYAIEPDVDVATRSLRIRAVVADAGRRGLRPGAFAKVNLAIQENEAIVIPTQALMPQARSNQVIVVRKGKAVFQNVTTGLRDQNIIQITSGLTIGDTVATTGLLFLKPDGAVKVGKMEGRPDGKLVVQQ